MRPLNTETSLLHQLHPYERVQVWANAQPTRAACEELHLVPVTRQCTGNTTSQKPGLKFNLVSQANLTAWTRPVAHQLCSRKPCFPNSKGQHGSTCRTRDGFKCWEYFVIRINAERTCSTHQPHKGVKEGSQQEQLLDRAKVVPAADSWTVPSRGLRKEQ